MRIGSDFFMVNIECNCSDIGYCLLLALKFVLSLIILSTLFCTVKNGGGDRCSNFGLGDGYKFLERITLFGEAKKCSRGKSH